MCQDHRPGQELEHPRGDHGLSEVWGAAAAGSGALYLRGRLRPFRQLPGCRDPRGGGRGEGKHAGATVRLCRGHRQCSECMIVCGWRHDCV